MPYVHISRVPGRELADYDSVVGMLGPEIPAGLLVSVTGVADGALQTVDLWESKEHADRFAAERLLPVFGRTGRGPGADATYVAFETDRVAIHQTALAAER